MRLLPPIALGVCWIAWLFPFVFLAPHRQRRQAITVTGPTLAGLFLQTLAIFLALNLRLPADSSPGIARLVPAAVLGIVSVVLAWGAVKHLGKQFRLQAGLYVDHELVRTGPYALVRHPIYAGLFGMLLSTILVMTPWTWGAVAVVLFVAGTEIRVRTEDHLLETRFGEAFRDYRHRVSAYLPFVR